MEVKLPQTRKRNIIILSVLAFLFAVSGGYLLWRVNQPDRISPEEGEAGIDCGKAPKNFSFNKPPTKDIGPFPKDGKVVLLYRSLSSTEYRPILIFKDKNGESYTYKIPELDSRRRAEVITEIAVEAGDYIELVSSDDDIDQGKHQCAPVKGPPYMSFGWIPPNSDETCGSGLPGPPSQYIPYGKSKVTGAMEWAKELGYEIVGNGSQCWADWREWPGDYDFNDYFLQISYATEENLCDGGNWESMPSGTYEYCQEISYSFVAEDSDGIDSNSVVVKLNNVGRTAFSKSQLGNKLMVSESISSATSCLDSGSYTLSASWEDSKGVGGDNCTLSTTFTVSEPYTPPPQPTPEPPPPAPTPVQQPSIPVQQTTVVPETGIFDETESTLTFGAILLFLGFSWTWIGERIYLFIDFTTSSAKKIVLSMKEVGSNIRERRIIARKQKEFKNNILRKKKFERKVVKE